MVDYDRATNGSDATEEAEIEHASNRSKTMVENTIKKFILFVSFGPGVLGFLWLIGRILRR